MASVIRSTRMLATRGIRMLQTRNYADASALKLTLAAANKVFYDETEVKQVDVPSFSGDFGILATHVPTLGKSRSKSESVRYANIIQQFFFSVCSRLETRRCHCLRK